MSISPEDRQVPLRNPVAQVQQGFHLARNKSHARKRLPDEDAEVRVHLSGRLIKSVYRSKRAAAGPAIRSNPPGLGSRNVAGKLCAHGMLTVGSQNLRQVLP